jgi:hypothetical protein
LSFQILRNIVSAHLIFQPQRRSDAAPLHFIKRKTASLKMTTPHRIARYGKGQKNSPRIADGFMAFLLSEPKVLRRFEL